MWNIDGQDDIMVYILLLILIICCFATNLVNKALSRPVILPHHNA